MDKPLILFVLLAFLGYSGPLAAQEGASALTVTPSVGFGGVIDGGRLESGGMNTIIQIDLARKKLRWGLFASVRGIGAWCSDGCDLSGQTLGAEATFLLGGAGVGIGLGLTHRSAGWSAQPHGQLSFVRGGFRVQLRLEVSRGSNGVHLPLLIGWPIQVG